MILTIVGNLACMLIDSHPFNHEYSVVTEKLNFVFEVLYISELTIKLIAFGFKDYVHQHSMNIYDSLVVVASLVDICLVLIMTNNGEEETALEA
jgi:Ion transport protein